MTILGRNKKETKKNTTTKSKSTQVKKVEKPVVKEEVKEITQPIVQKEIKEIKPKVQSLENFLF